MLSYPTNSPYRLAYTCEQCGTSFEAGRYRPRRFCSHRCSEMALRGKPIDFEKRIDKSGECWSWTGGTNKDGYGVVSIGRKRWLAHRFAYTLSHGPIPDGLMVLHSCDNPPCCRLEHLFLGTRADNVADMAAKGRAKFGTVDPTKPRHVILTPGEVIAIRHEFLRGSTNLTLLAKKYGVTTANICRIIHYQTWKHIA